MLCDGLEFHQVCIAASKKSFRIHHNPNYDIKQIVKVSVRQGLNETDLKKIVVLIPNTHNTLLFSFCSNNNNNNKICSPDS